MAVMRDWSSEREKWLSGQMAATNLFVASCFLNTGFIVLHLIEDKRSRLCFLKSFHCRNNLRNWASMLSSEDVMVIHNIPSVIPMRMDLIRVRLE